MTRGFGLSFLDLIDQPIRPCEMDLASKPTSPTDLLPLGAMCHGPRLRGNAARLISRPMKDGTGSEQSII
jgi:hypothetical protein